MQDINYRILVNKSGCFSNIRCCEFLNTLGLDADCGSYDGIGMYDTLRSNRYDSVITDIFIPAYDAIGVKRLCDMNIDHPIKFFGVLPNNNTEIENAIIDTDFSYYFVKPKDEQIVATTVYEQMVKSSFGIGLVETTETAVASIFRNLSVSVEHIGYHYALEAIKLFAANTDVSLQVTKIIYPIIAKKYNTTASNVEKTIRVMIDCSWKAANPLYQIKYFGYSNRDNIKRPTNLAFIATLANIVNLHSEHSLRLYNFAH